VAEVVRAELELEPVGRAAPRRGHHTGIVYEEVEALVTAPETLGERPHGVQVREIELLDLELRTRQGGLDRLPRALALLDVAAREHDARARPRELARRDLTEAAVGPRDDRQPPALWSGIRSAVHFATL